MPHDERQDHSFVKSRLLLSIDALKPYEKDLIKRAVSFAEEVHANHYRLPLKPNLERRTPFVVHPMRVALILIEELGINHPEPISAALLHDIVEDSSGAISTFDLEKQFGRHVALMVSCMTRPAPDPKIPGEQQMAVYYERIAHSARYTRIIKLAERLDNLRDLADSTDPDFRQEYVRQSQKLFLPIAANTDAVLQVEIAKLCRELEPTLTTPSTASGLAATD